MSSQCDFSDIAPIDDQFFSSKMAALVREPGFEHAVKYVMPQVDYENFKKILLDITNKDEFQHKIMQPFLELLCSNTTTGITCGGLENINPASPSTFVTNHRDIVLDASFLNLCFLRKGYPTSEVAIGNNLLIFDWITDLVKLNKSFIVKRDLKLTKALEAARQLSAYIHYAINDKHASVWIAQREGRAKDSNDKTQEAVIKMLGLAGGGSLIDNIRSLNIVPVAISYEYDPNDYLKAREFLLKRLDPEFKKSQHDDLFAMETGLLQPKGHVHFEIGSCINDSLDLISPDIDKHEMSRTICHLIDCSIHKGYRIYPINYIAYDMLHHSDFFSDRYSPAEKTNFEAYLRSQLEKVEVEGKKLSDLDNSFMFEMMLNMYANPLKNKLQANGKCESR